MGYVLKPCNPHFGFLNPLFAEVIEEEYCLRELEFKILKLLFCMLHSVLPFDEYMSDASPFSTSTWRSGSGIFLTTFSAHALRTCHKQSIMSCTYASCQDNIVLTGESA
jgi:hypothetical protein